MDNADEQGCPRDTRPSQNTVKHFLKEVLQTFMPQRTHDCQSSQLYLTVQIDISETWMLENILRTSPSISSFRASLVPVMNFL